MSNHDYRKGNKFGRPDGVYSSCLTINPQRIRALGTGIGQAASAAVETGSSRARRVAEEMPADQRAVLSPGSGYPPDPMLWCPAPTLSGPPAPEPGAIALVTAPRQTRLR